MKKFYRIIPVVLLFLSGCSNNQEVEQANKLKNIQNCIQNADIEYNNTWDSVCTRAWDWNHCNNFPWSPVGLKAQGIREESKRNCDIYR